MNKQESEKLEFKASFSEWKEIIIALTAFANKHGGKVIVGLNDKNELTGSQIGKGTLEDLANKIKNHTDPVLYPSLNVKTFGPGEIVEIEVKESDNKPVFAFDRAYTRVGRTNQKLSQAEVRQLIKKYTLPDFDADLFGKPLRSLDLDEELAAKLKKEKFGLFKKGKLTNAGYLCLIKRNRLMPNAVVKAARFKGKNMVNFIDMKDFDLNIIRTVDEVIDFIKRHINMEVIVSGKAKRESVWDYPLSSIREAVINAVVHREYSDPGNVQVRIFDDRLEIWSPGLLPKELNVKNLLEENRSIPRNKIIAKVFHFLGLMEGWGTGFHRIVQGCAKNGSPRPLFQEKTGAFVIVIYKKPKSGGISGGVNKLLSFIAHNPGKSSIQAASAVGSPPRTVEKWLERLRKERKIEYRGSKKTGGYFILNK